MSGVIGKEVNYITESVALLQHLGSGEKYADLRETLNKKYANTLREGLQKLERLDRIEQCAEKV